MLGYPLHTWKEDQLTAVAQDEYVPLLIMRKDMPNRMSKKVFLFPAEDSPTFRDHPDDFVQEALKRAKWWLPEQNEIVSLHAAFGVARTFTLMAREEGYDRDIQLDLAEIERRFEHRLGTLIREGQEAGIFTAPGQNAPGMISVRELLDTGRTRVTKFKQVAGLTPEQLDDLIAEGRQLGTLSQENLLNLAAGREIKTREQRHPKEAAASRAKVRSASNAGKRHLSSEKIATTLSEQLEAVGSSLELVNPDELEPEVRKETLDSIRETCNLILKEIKSW